MLEAEGTGYATVLFPGSLFPPRERERDPGNKVIFTNREKEPFAV